MCVCVCVCACVCVSEGVRVCVCACMARPCQSLPSLIFLREQHLCGLENIRKHIVFDQADRLVESDPCDDDDDGDDDDDDD